jgi:inosine-uridine nucleoside N-ribohydrolase
MSEKVILDVDTGSDDAIAIIAAVLSPKIELLGISTVNGNRSVDITTTNTLRLLDYLGVELPVYRGCHLPMVASLLAGRRKNVPYNGPENKEEDVHGSYLPLPETAKTAQPEHAVFWLLDTLKNSGERITVITIGPLTNLAMALRIAPEIVENMKEIIIMGGGYQVNNITSGAEFNFWIDPEAAKIVADCGAPLRVVPLDATHEAYISWKEAEEFVQMGTPASIFCGKLIQQRISGYNNFQPMPVYNTAPIHDVLAVCSLIDPDVLKSCINVNMDISFSPGITDGMSLFDIEGRDRNRKANAIVARGANREKFVDLLKQLLGSAFK